MISILAIVALIVTHTTGSIVMEFSEKALEAARSVHPRNSLRVQAELLRARTEITLQAKRDPLRPYPELTLVPDPSPNHESLDLPVDNERRWNATNSLTYFSPEARVRFHCGRLHGIHLENEHFPSCNITEINMIAGTTQYRGVTQNTFRFSILFKHKMTSTLRLDIHVLQLPSDLDWLNEEKLIAWANAAKVGLFTPFNVPTVRDMVAGRHITVDFQWLSHLLQLDGIIKLANINDSTSPPLIPTYVTRPLVLPEDLISEYFNGLESMVL